MNKIQLEVVGLSYSQSQTGAFALVLSEIGGVARRLPIIIGAFEAQAISIELEKIPVSRPLTHDLFKKMGDAFHFTVKEVIIYNLLEGIFYAKLICVDHLHNEVEIDSRTSDAIAIAVRFNCPIYTYEFILASAGITINSPESIDTPLDFENESTELVNEAQEITKRDFSAIPQSELEHMLANAIENEEYELASQIRDELERRKL